MIPADAMPLPAERVTVRAGQVLQIRAQRPQVVGFLEQGRVAIGLLDPQGRLDQRLGTLEAPCWIEPACAVLGLPLIVDVVTDTASVVSWVRTDDLAGWVGGLPRPVHAFVRDLALANHRQTETAVSRLAKDAEARCAEWLLRHAQTLERGKVAVPLTHRKRVIAEQLGIAPETLSRVLRALRERGLIVEADSCLNLLDPAGLRQLAGV